MRHRAGTLMATAGFALRQAAVLRELHLPFPPRAPSRGRNLFKYFIYLTRKFIGNYRIKQKNIPERNISVFTGSGCGVTRQQAVCTSARLITCPNILGIIKDPASSLPSEIHCNVNFGPNALLNRVNNIL